MEHHESERQEGIEVSQPAPASLLPAVLDRLERRRAYVAAGKSTQDYVNALHHPQWEVRSAAIRALGELESYAPLDPLLAMLHDEHRQVRAAALRALGRLADRVPLEHILLALRDPEWEVREMAVLVLGELGKQRPDLLPALLRMAQHDTHSNVRDAAQYALRKYDTASDVAMSRSAETVVQTRVSTQSHAQPWSYLMHVCAHNLLVFKRQVALIHRSIWIGSFLLMLFWSVECLHIPLPFFARGDMNTARVLLALFTAVSAAAGSAFIYGGENDAGFELTLSTATSIRVVMFCRFILVVGYNMLLALCASTLIVQLNGGGFWSVVQLWLGPMMLLSTLTLLLSLLVGSWFSACVGLVVEISQALGLNMYRHLPTLEISFSSSWQTSPVLLFLAALLLMFALFYAPRQPRLAAL